MISQILRTFFWVCLAVLISYSAEIPKECSFGAPDYNETLCSETCTKKIHTNESYCSNFTQSTLSVEKQPQQEAEDAVALSGIMAPTTREGIHLNLTTPKIDFEMESSAVSLKGSVMASFCVLLFAYF